MGFAVLLLIAKVITAIIRNDSAQTISFECTLILLTIAICAEIRMLRAKP